MEHRARMDASKHSAVDPSVPCGAQRRSPHRPKGGPQETPKFASGRPWACFVCLCFLGSSSQIFQAQTAPSQNAGESSSTQKIQRKSVHHTRVSEGDSPSPDLAQAEELIQHKDYSKAEPLLRKVVDADPANYVAWFDLGFLKNAVGQPEESIAAYRKSVAAKPDVFESNLNLGLQLAKTGDPDAEQFLRAATQLKPTSHPGEGLARAWLSLAHVVEAR